ncbi:MAG: NADH:flavin oxidoreductase/NADH oxidase [Actinomycetes bacterium]
MALFEPLTLRSSTFRNRAWISPMCQYSSVDGMANRWHDVHLGAFATGGAGLVMTEATAVTPEGRITPHDLGLWSDEQGERLAPIVAFAQEYGAKFGIQLAHAGRKASTAAPWAGGGYVDSADGGWEAVGAAAVPFGGLPAPRELSPAAIAGVVSSFAAAAVRAEAIGCDVVEIHGAHGYLIHSFLSPLANTRSDSYGRDFAGRTRLALEVAAAVRAVWPEAKPLLFRISVTDWAQGGWTPEETVELARELARLGVDLIDCSSGGQIPDAKIPAAPGYHVPFATQIRRGANIATAAVGLITDPQQAETIVSEGQADAVLIGRAALRDPHWPLRAAAELGATVTWPNQYQRARL